ncbi:MAG TPA: signal peptidase I, partial [Acidimicrobiales bacterium]|nr:signal peptidase I [Acidimicrobiales bacterium]
DRVVARWADRPRHLASERGGDGPSRPPASGRGAAWMGTVREGALDAAGNGNGRGDGDRGGGDDGGRGDGPGGGSVGTPPPRSLRRTILEWVAVIGGGVLIALVVEAFFVQAFWIPSPSMVPTLEVGDRVLVNKLSYKLHDVHRGDVVVFRRPPAASHGGEDEIKDLIKRVIAVEGDTIEGRDGKVYVNGERIEEPYLVDDTATDNLPLTTIPEGKVFVMGDNRTDSEDSRVFGPIDEDSIVGRAVVKVLPLSDLGWL